MAFTITNVAFASNEVQQPNLEVLINTYDWGLFGSGTSDYCTTQSHINLRVENSSGSISALLQYRGPNQAWQDFGTTYKSITNSYTFNMNAVIGNDYRLKLKTNAFSAKGVILCW